MARPRSALTAFILSLPHNVPVQNVIAQAKARGLNVAESNVYRVRRLYTKGPSTSPVATTVAEKPASKPAAPSRRPQAKSNFIRQQPASLSATEVVAKGKAQGLKFTNSLVYMVRGPKAKKDAGKKTSAAKPRAAQASKAQKSKSVSPTSKPASTASSKPAEPSKSELIRRQPGAVPAKSVVAKAKAGRARSAGNGASIPSPTRTSSSVEDLLRAVAAELGLGLAVGILEGERERVRQVIGG